jgi:hypothetical protein
VTPVEDGIERNFGIFWIAALGGLDQLFGPFLPYYSSKANPLSM